MARRSTIAFLVGLVLSATLAHGAGLHSGPSRSIEAMPHQFHGQHFRGSHIAHRFPNDAVLGGYDIGDLGGSDVEDGGPGTPVVAPSAPTSNPEPKVVDLPPCSETGPGGVTIMRGGTCAHRPASQ